MADRPLPPQLSPTWLADEVAAHRREELADRIHEARERVSAAERAYAQAETELIQARRAYHEIVRGTARKVTTDVE
jgi:F0F1-type ATP synthase membrane subunit b/b'